METVHEYSEWLSITTGVPGTDQEGSFMNATLQDVDDVGLSFSVAVHVGIPAGIETEEALRDHLRRVFETAIEATGGSTLAVEIQLGPTEEPEDEEEAEDDGD